MPIQVSKEEKHIVIVIKTVNVKTLLLFYRHKQNVNGYMFIKTTINSTTITLEYCLE